MFLSKLPFSGKIALPVLIAFLLTISLSFWGSNNLWQAMKEERLASVMHMSKAAKNVAEYYHSLEKSGALSREEAQNQAKASINAMRFDDGAGYVFVYDYDGLILVQADKKLVGTQAFLTKDADGKLVVQDLINVAKNGGGVHYYKWNKPGESAPLEKLSWTEGVSDWNWMIGTGVYIDDMESAFYNNAIIDIIIVGLGLIFTSGLCYIIIGSINRPFAKLVSAMQGLASGKSDIVLEEVHRQDEIGGMARTLQTFAENEQKRKALLNEQESQKNTLEKAALL